jgi:ABC-2 type transport system ATP-binding protein
MLDEPINGLDPSGIKEIRELILKLNKERKITILISSHILGELSKMANRYGVINNGVMVDEFTNEELEGRCHGELEMKVDNIDLAVKILSAIVNISDIRVIDEKTIRVTKDLDKAGLFNTELAKNGVSVSSSGVVGQDLEDYFMHLMDITDKSLS